MSFAPAGQPYDLAHHFDDGLVESTASYAQAMRQPDPRDSALGYPVVRASDRVDHRVAFGGLL